MENKHSYDVINVNNTSLLSLNSRTLQTYSAFMWSTEATLSSDLNQKRAL